MSPNLGKTIVVGAFALLATVATSAIARADVQNIRIAETGWHFVALQVRPDDPSPAKVFAGNTTGAAIRYDAIWSYDSSDGWRVFVPASATTASDLVVIEALRGYWIHVTEVSAGGASFQVVGTPVSILETGPAKWQAVGFPIDPAAKDLSIADALPGLGSVVENVIAAAWSYDRAKGRLVPLDLAAPCTPGDLTKCVQAGLGYWILPKQSDLKAGQLLTIKTKRIALTPSSPIAKVDLEFAGVHTLPGTPVDLYFEPGTGTPASSLSSAASVSAQSLKFFESKAISIDGKRAFEAGAEKAMNGAGACSKCPDGRQCASICVTPDRSDPALFVGLDQAAMLSLSQYQSAPSAVSSFGSIVVMMNGKRVGKIAVQAEPMIIKGRYTGVLTYENGVQGVPIEMILDQCRTTSTSVGGQGLECNDRSLITGVINPVLQGRRFNGRDDDNDGLVDDESGEDQAIPTRHAPGFPPNTVLHGRAGEVQGELRLTLSGSQTLDAEYPAASNRCENVPAACDLTGQTGRCSGTGKKCCNPSNCLTEDPAGIWSVAARQNREITIEARFLSPTSLVGTLTERHIRGSEANQNASDVWSVGGTFMLSRIDAPVCASILTGNDVPFRPLGIGCRSDEDCPSRCTVGDGNSETESDWDPATKTSGGWGGECTNRCGNANGKCKHYTCSFLEFGRGLENARKFQSLTVKAKTGTVEVIGDGTRRVGSLQDGSLSLADLPCGKYDVVVQAPACPPSTSTRRKVYPIDTCSGSSQVVTADFDDCSQVTPQVIPVGMSGSGVNLIGNITSSIFAYGYCSNDSRRCSTDCDCRAVLTGECVDPPAGACRNIVNYAVSGSLDSGAAGGVDVLAIGGEVGAAALVPGGSVVDKTSGTTRVIPRFTNVSSSYVDDVSLRHGLLEAIKP